MLDIRKILVPTDFSQHAVSAYTQARELAGRFDSKVDLIHIIPVFSYINESISRLGVPFDMDKDLYPHLLDDAKNKLEEILNRYFKDEHKGKSIARIENKPGRAIANAAAEEGHDLILMAAQGGQGSDLLRGGTTEKVVKHSTVPVFVVDNQFKSDDLKRVLVPTDVSLISFAAIPMAMTLAETFGAEILLFHVLELYGSESENLERKPDKPEKIAIYENIISRLKEFFKQKKIENISIDQKEEAFIAEILVSDGSSKKTIPLKTIIEKGISAHYEIEMYAPDKADLIVMATHGHTGLAHFFLGSTTEKVIQHVEMPVVTVRPDKKVLK